MKGSGVGTGIASGQGIVNAVAAIGGTTVKLENLGPVLANTQATCGGALPQAAYEMHGFAGVGYGVATSSISNADVERIARRVVELLKANG